MSRTFEFSCFLLLIFSLSAVGLQAQSINPQVINAGGMPSKSGTISLDYSIGEQSSITQYNGDANVKLSAGFLQSYTTLVTGLLISPKLEDVSFQLFPNPSADYTTVKGVVRNPGYLGIQLIDIQGHILESFPTTYYQNLVEKTISISNLPAGLYFIRLTYSSEGTTQAATLKLIKSHR